MMTPALMLLLCSFVLSAVGTALLVVAPAGERELSPADLSMSRPVVRPCWSRAHDAYARMRRLGVGLWMRRAPRTVVVFDSADRSAARTFFAGRISELRTR